MSGFRHRMRFARQKLNEHGPVRFVFRAMRIAVIHAVFPIRRQRYRFYRSSTFTYRGIDATAVVNSPWELDRIKGGLETYVLDSFHEAGIRRTDVFFEVGANIGLNSLIMAASLDRSRISVVAFEPEPSNTQSLSKNILLNGLENLLIMPIGLSDSDGIKKFFLDYENTRSGQGGHSIEFFDSLHHAATHIPVMTLDHAIEQFGLEPPTLVNLDVEGHEEAVLNGMRDILRRGTIRVLVVEIDGFRDPSQSTIPSLLSELGYELVDYQSGPEGVRPHCLGQFVRSAQEAREIPT